MSSSPVGDGKRVLDPMGIGGLCEAEVEHTRL